MIEAQDGETTPSGEQVRSTAPLLGGELPPNAAISPILGGDAAGASQWMISFFETANESSAFHELGHHILTALVSMFESGQMDADFSDSFNKVMQELGVTLDDFLNDRVARSAAQEKFAKLWESYLSTGNAPSKELRSVFSQLRKWLIDVYHDITNALGVELSPEMAAFFDKLLATPEEINAEHKARKTVGDIAVEDQELTARIAQIEAESRLMDEELAAWNEYDQA